MRWSERRQGEGELQGGEWRGTSCEPVLGCGQQKGRTWRWRREGSDVGRGKWELREHAARKGEFDFVVIAHNGRSGRGQGREG